MQIRFVIDRIVGSSAVCLADGNPLGLEQLDLPCDCLCGMSEGDVFSAEVCGDKVSDITPLPEETSRRRDANRAKLSRLINKQKRKTDKKGSI